MKKFFTSWYTLTISLFLVLILLTAVGLPFFVEWMKPLWVRLSFTFGFIALWLLWWFLRRRKIKKAEEALAKELAGPDPSGDEAEAVQARMAEALAELRKTSGKKRNYLYSLPWYVIIGPPGAGKTTALVNSGLRFPFTDETLGGTGGTRNLDFMFAEEAVLVDTAGRYTTQDSDREVDSAGWKRLLESLAKHRPFEPINGVFVAIPADDLQRGDVKVIDEHAAIIRRRLREIRETLQTELPVYLLITKSDKLSGLTEYFGDLDVEGRRAVVGHTFDWKHKKLTSEDVTSAFDAFTNDLAARSPKRLEEEKDIRRRGLILGFPGQVRAMRASLHRLVEGAFVNEDRPSGQLRGFYLTSGTQDGSAIDRILEGVSQAYDRNDPKQREGGKAYFLNRLLTEVAFGEAGLPISDPTVVRKRQTRMTAMVAGIAALAVLAIGLWTVSFLGNRDFQNQTEIAAAEIENEMDMTRTNLAKVGAADTPLEQLVPLLNKLRNLPEGYAARKAGGPSIFMRFGLFQSGLSRRNEEAYRIALRRILLPRIILRLEEKMRQEMDNAVLLYEPLKIYLMLGGAAPEGQIKGNEVRDYIGRDWASEVYPSAEMAGLRDDLALHLEALVEDPNISQSWAGQKAPLDANLVRAARASVGTMSLAERAFIIMRSKASDPSKDWSMDLTLSDGDAMAFANPEEVMSMRVPYFFTKEGFQTSYRTQKLAIGNSLRGELWVLGESVNSSSVQRDLSNLDTGISGAYAKAYIEHWQDVIDSLQPADYFNNPEAFSAFAKGVSPLELVLEVVRENTTFDNQAEEAAGQMLENRVNRNRVGRVVNRIAGPGDGPTGRSADELISRHFRDVNEWVGDSENPGKIKEFVDAVKQTFQKVRQAQAAGNSGNSAALIAEATSALETASLGVPDLVQDFAKGVSSGGTTTGNKTLQSEVKSFYAENVAPSCTSAVDGKYPFDRGSDTDSAIGAMQAAFGSAGQVSTFVQNRLEPYLDRSGDYWRWDPSNPVASKLSPAAPKNFETAAEITAVLNQGIPLAIGLAGNGADVSRVELKLGSNTLNFDPVVAGNPAQAPQQYLWSALSGGLQSSELRIFRDDGVEGMPVEQEIYFRKKEGIWSLLRIFDENDDFDNLSTTRVKATFNQGSGEAQLVVSFPEGKNPFGGGDLWSVQCPQTL